MQQNRLNWSNMVQKTSQAAAAVTTTASNTYYSWQKVSYSKKPPAKNTANSNAKSVHRPATTTTAIKTAEAIVSKNTVTSALTPPPPPAAVGKQKENNYNKLNVGQQRVPKTKTPATTVSVRAAVVGNVTAKLYVQPQPQQRQQHQQQQSVELRRRRNNLREIKQIRRAHRHLLTSGGNDRQQLNSAGTATAQKQQQRTTTVKRKCQRHVSCCSCTTSSTATTKTQQKQKSSLGCENKRNVRKSRRVRSKRQINHNVQERNKSKEAYAESVISSRWCSIEEQLDWLGQLLYYCDEETILDSSWSSISSIEDDKQPLYIYAENAEDQLDQQNLEVIEGTQLYWSDMSAVPSDVDDDGQSTTSGAGSSSTTSLVPASLKRRGHQHHPRFSGTRRPVVPPNVREILDAIYRGDVARTDNASDTMSTLDDSCMQSNDDTMDLESDDLRMSKSTLNLPLTDSVNNSLGSNSPTPTDDSSMLDEGVISAQTPTTGSMASSANNSSTASQVKKKKSKREKSETNGEKAERKKRTKKDKLKRSSACHEQLGVGEIDRNGSGAIDEGIAIDDDDTQVAEWAQLRCTSEAAEIVAEREARRNKGRCADYPGLAFGRSIFSSDTMMKFNIIRNELHNIMNTQLKRVNTKYTVHSTTPTCIGRVYLKYFSLIQQIYTNYSFKQVSVNMFALLVFAIFCEKIQLHFFTILLCQLVCLDCSAENGENPFIFSTSVFL